MIRDNRQMTPEQSTSSLLDRPQTALRFRFKGGQRDGQIVRINAAKCTIGSSPEATFRLVCPGVHPVHCLILRGAGGTAIRRMSADTYLNRQTFEDAELKPGDCLTLGPIEFQILEDVGTSRPASSGHRAAPPALAPSAADKQLRAEFEEKRIAWEQQRDEERKRLDIAAQELEERTCRLNQEREAYEAAHAEQEAGLNAEIHALREQLEQAHEIRSQAELEWSQAREKMTDELSDIRQQLLDKENEAGEVASQLESLQSQVVAFAETADELDQLRARCEQLTRDLETATQQHEGSISQEQLAELQAEWDRERESLQQQVDGFHAEIGELKARCEQAEAIAAENEAIGETLAKLEAKVQELESARIQDREELEAARANLADAQQQMQSVQDESERIREELENALRMADSGAGGQTSEEVPTNLVEASQPDQTMVLSGSGTSDAGPATSHAPSLLEPQAETSLGEYVEYASDIPTEAYEDPYAYEPDVEQHGIEASGGQPDSMQDIYTFQQDEEQESEPVPDLEPVNQVSLSYEEQPHDPYAYEPPDDAAAYEDDHVPQDTAGEMLNRLRAETDFSASAVAYDASDEQIEEATDEAEEPVAASGPISEEDLVFEEPSDVAPVDTASILAKFGHSLDFEDEGPEVEPPIPAVTETTFIADPPADPYDDGESIDDYMTQLLQRVGGERYQAQSSMDSKTEEVKEIAKQIKRPTLQRIDNTKPLDPSEFVPRAVAPEASSNLQTLRAVANTSARSAIDKHQRSSLDRAAMMCWFIAIVAAIVCFATAFFAEDIVSVPALASCVAFVVSFLSALKALAYSARAKFGARSTKKKLAANIEQASVQTSQPQQADQPQQP